ncbi:hypothetical protein NL676_009241 [Syzygium grande]|nr:hypothetical protein NL676_009241 [Syzygium grande]
MDMVGNGNSDDWLAPCHTFTVKTENEMKPSRRTRFPNLLNPKPAVNIPVLSFPLPPGSEPWMEPCPPPTVGVGVNGPKLRCERRVVFVRISAFQVQSEN